MRRRLRRTVLAMAIAVACNPAQAAPQVQAGKDFQMLVASGDTGGDIIVVAGVREIKGKLAICGLIWFEHATGTTISIERQFTSRIGFSIGGVALPPPTDAFRRYKSPEDAEAKGWMAGCSVTRIGWKAGYANMPLRMSAHNITVTQ